MHRSIETRLNLSCLSLVGFTYFSVILGYNLELIRGREEAHVGLVMGKVKSESQMFEII